GGDQAQDGDRGEYQAYANVAYVPTSQDGTKWAVWTISAHSGQSALRLPQAPRGCQLSKRNVGAGQIDRSPYSTRSSSARSGRSAPWVGRWTITMPSSAMSPTSTRVTPRGRSRRAEISAMERMSRHRAAMARCSTVSLGERSP